MKGSGFRVQGCGGGFAAIEGSGRSCSGIRYSLSHIRRFSSLRMTKRGDARRFAGGRLAHRASRLLIGDESSARQ